MRVNVCRLRVTTWFGASGDLMSSSAVVSTWPIPRILSLMVLFTCSSTMAASGSWPVPCREFSLVHVEASLMLSCWSDSTENRASRYAMYSVCDRLMLKFGRAMILIASEWLSNESL